MSSVAFYPNRILFVCVRACSGLISEANNLRIFVFGLDLSAFFNCSDFLWCRQEGDWAKATAI